MTTDHIHIPNNSSENRSRRMLTADESAAIRNNPPRNLRFPEAAAYLTVSERKLHDLVKRRRIPVVRLGGRLIFRLEDLDQALARLSGK